MSAKSRRESLKKKGKVSAKVPTHVEQKKKFLAVEGGSRKIFKVIQRWISNVKSAVFGAENARAKPLSKSFFHNCCRNMRYSVAQLFSLPSNSRRRE